MSAECKRLNDGTGPVCSCSGAACALESTQRLLNKRRLGSFYLDDVRVLADELERARVALREARDAIAFLAEFYAVPHGPRFVHDPVEWHGGMQENIARCPTCVVNAALAVSPPADEAKR